MALQQSPVETPQENGIKAAQGKTHEADKVSGLYNELQHWELNTGDKIIHAKRMPGRFRNLKYLTALSWIPFFLGPYLRWDGKQAILFDIPAGQFHIFSLTIFPQDLWMLSLILLFLAITLFAVTSVAGRVFCGYFCFQTIWTDAYTWIEEKFEGNPSSRHKLDKTPWNLHKIRIKTGKHALWLAIAIFTGISFAAWFTDAYQLWFDYFTLQAPIEAWIVLAMFTGGTYLFAGFMREQVCFWLCPYARIQGVMTDRQTIVPSYDFNRGEPRGKIIKNPAAETKKHGDCIDCFQCVAVCPTGVDIRFGQQEGCITCGLCLDACDSVMDKISRPRGLIRYASLDAIEGKPEKNLLHRPRVLIYLGILSAVLFGVIFGLTHLGVLKLQVIHSRQPLFVQLSNGDIQNRYDIKVLNKTSNDMKVQISANGVDGHKLVGAEAPLLAKNSGITMVTIFVQAPRAKLANDATPIEFRIDSLDHGSNSATYQSVFVGPRKN